MSSANAPSVPEPVPNGGIEVVSAFTWDGVMYKGVDNAEPISYLKVRKRTKKGDIFNAYTEREHRYGIVFDGVSFASSVAAALPGIIQAEKGSEGSRV